MSHNDFELEPIPGLPAHLPEGEHIVWQGSPNKKAFAKSILHQHKIMFYFAILVIWNLATGLYDGRNINDILFTIGTLIVGGAIVLMIISWYSKAIERTTIYTLTNKRVVMRFGIALPVTFNLPFAQINNADAKLIYDDFGTISLGLKEHTKISWAILWPHVRPWRLAQPEPSIRVIKDFENVASLLSAQLHAFHDIEKHTTLSVKQELQPANTEIRNSTSFGKPVLEEQGV